MTLLGFKVCRFRDLIKGDQFLDPTSGALARVTDTARERVPSGPDRVTVKMTMVVSHGAATLTLRHDRPIRRKFREGETE